MQFVLVGVGNIRTIHEIGYNYDKAHDRKKENLDSRLSSLFVVLILFYVLLYHHRLRGQ